MVDGSQVIVGGHDPIASLVRDNRSAYFVIWNWKFAARCSETWPGGVESNRFMFPAIRTNGPPGLE